MRYLFRINDNTGILNKQNKYVLQFYIIPIFFIFQILTQNIILLLYNNNNIKKIVFNDFYVLEFSFANSINVRYNVSKLEFFLSQEVSISAFGFCSVM